MHIWILSLIAALGLAQAAAAAPADSGTRLTACAAPPAADRPKINTSDSIHLGQQLVARTARAAPPVRP